jgi:hypothetical protein
MISRKKFIETTGKYLSVSLVAPYILPSGRLFAPTGERIANHVVLCLFAGGVRNIESIHHQEGNLMPNTLRGNDAISSSIAEGMTALPRVSKIPIQNFGTLFKEFRFKEGPTAHVSGHLTSITGSYFLNGHNPKYRSPYPTIFEYYRKHSNPMKSAINAWWIAERNDPFNICNYSLHPEYGPTYGANYFHPAGVLKNGTSGIFAKSKFADDILSDDERQLRIALNSFFQQSSGAVQQAFHNNFEDSVKISKFILDCSDEAEKGMYKDPYGIGEQNMNDDLYNIFFAEKILTYFKPELLIVNMMAIDLGHTDFTMYCNNMRKADYALAKLWNTIQSNPELKDDTILIAVPEHGRNLQPNTLKDKYGRFALDHTGDNTSREIFSLILGAPHLVNQNVSISQNIGESIDIAPTIASVLGFYDKVEHRLNGKPLVNAFA